MRRYRQLAHTADIGLEACGKDLGEAFAGAACGMFSLMTDRRRIRLKDTCRLAIAESDLEGLLFSFLNRLIYLFDAEQRLFRCCRVKIQGSSLEAGLMGERFDPARHAIKIGIKGATYHALAVDGRQNRVRVFFDI